VILVGSIPADDTSSAEERACMPLDHLRDHERIGGNKDAERKDEEV
jgi:hypothetical protein